MENEKLPLPLKLKNADFKFENQNIKIDIKTDIPEKLYKYYSITDYSVKGLKNNTMYFSHSHLLNDVMDGNFILWDMSEFIINYKADLNINYNIDSELTKEILKQLSEPFLECRGVLSLSDTYKNELIWAHYTSEIGYCLELETIQFKEHIEKNRNENDLYFFPISYDHLKQINFSDFINYKIVAKSKEINSKTVSAILPILYCFAQKDDCWKYENEWRFLLRDKKFNSISFPIEIINDQDKLEEDYRKSGGNIEINPKVISKIILAPLFFNNSRFNKLEVTNSNFLIYNFKGNDAGKVAKDFLEILKHKFNDKIYQVDKIIKDGLVVRELKYKIEIVDIGENFIKIFKNLIYEEGR
ncbi:DUF2971 domain-containing protein [Pedobacter sp. SL55]|uniref:DUF2971 domain-containing protein n=1 Tax=Pedobacter sp. SL55 TaxID=2995161 RepID=UPI00226F031A|nr:DUF2971 domain-containing protein [Pedobacter sp. SL55]WAC42651.1 DUF2971 domain-containing protein [Pedobacter sp. SL55]